jgi:hypothetical protein
MARARAKPTPKPEEIERRLFEFSLGPLRLLDTVLGKAGKGELAGLLRDLLINWRAYPSRTVYSRKDLLRFESTLGRIEAGLRKARLTVAAAHVATMKGEIEGWTRPRSR